MCTGHTSTPRRWSGKTAAELPTWPYATEDWMDRIVVTGPSSQTVGPSGCEAAAGVEPQVHGFPSDITSTARAARTTYPWEHG